MEIGHRNYRRRSRRPYRCVQARQSRTQGDGLRGKSRTGGQAATFPIAGTDLEIFYHHLFTGDREILDLIDELGLTRTGCSGSDSRVGFFVHGREHDLSKATDLLFFRALPPLDRFRVGLLTLYLQRTKDWKHFEKITAQEWIRKYAGKNVFNDVWGARDTREIW